MSVPSEFDLALVKIGDGGSPEAFTQVCGMVNGTINQSAQSSDRYVPDCTAPFTPATRKQRVTGIALDVSASGLTNSAQVPTLMAALGVLKNYKIELYQDDGTAAGDLMGTLAMASHMTAFNMSITKGGDASSEITLPSHGAWAYTEA